MKSVELPILFQTSNKFAATQVRFQKWSLILMIQQTGIVIGYDELEEIFAEYRANQSLGYIGLPKSKVTEDGEL